MKIIDIYTQVRTALDSDSTELSDTLLGVWETECENRIFAEIHTATRLFGAHENVTGTGATQAFTLATVTEPRNVNGPLWELEPLPHEFALMHWPRNATEGTVVQIGHATHWSIADDTGKIWLWPAPISGDIHIVSGLKTPTVTDTSNTNNTCALPAKYHPLVADYLIARGYQLQQNAQMASMIMQRFEAELDVHKRDDNRPPKTGVTTIGSDELRKPRTPVGRLSWPWE